MTANFALILGDCTEEMRRLPENSVDAIVTDPPYGLQFMGREWDKLWRDKSEADTAWVDRQAAESDGLAARRRKLPALNSTGTQMQEWHFQWALEAYRILKPGGHIAAFGGTRTYHRLASAIEDAGFEIRDCLQWLYGSGFPKSHNLSKAIDKAAGAEREVMGKHPCPSSTAGRVTMGHGNLTTSGFQESPDIIAPATEAAKRWDGWGTALKPANEPIVLARKPPIGTVAENVLQFGTGALNIDGCRIAHTGAADLAVSQRKNPGRDDLVASSVYGSGRPQQSINAAGRWPANVILDEAAAELLDEQTGQVGGSTTGAGPRPVRRSGKRQMAGWGLKAESTGINYGDIGGASRFFYCAKASKSERGQGNDHPTVKPVSLMEWLIRLLTPPGGTVLDPFTGSGTTGVAAVRLGFSFVGIERDQHYHTIAALRIETAAEELEGQQLGLDLEVAA